MANVFRLQNTILRRALGSSLRNVRFIQNTSQKKADVTACPPATQVTEQYDIEKIQKKNWISYGFDHHDKEADRNAMHSVLFASITVCLVLAGYFLAYLPDYALNDWAQREAFLELKRREDCGLPLVDPNLIDPKKITLPTEDELEGVEIII